MAERQINLRFRVTDDGTVVLDRIAQGISKVDHNVKSMNSSLTLIKWDSIVNLGRDILGVAGYLKGFIDEAGKAEQVESRMAFQVEQIGAQYKNVKTAIDDFSKSIENTTRFSQEAAKQGFGTMLQYTNELEKALSGTKLAMDISTQTGHDFDSAIRYVGMAMNGNVEILGRWIPELRNLDDALGKDASSGQKAEYAMRILNEKFGGAAQKDLDTYSGKMAQLHNRIDDISRGIGEKLLGALDWAKTTTFFQDWWLGVDSILGISAKKAGTAENAARAQKILNDEQKIIDLTKIGREEITKYTSAIDELNISYKILGQTSSVEVLGSLSKAEWALGKMEEGWKKGTVSVLDYGNALQKVMEMYKGISGQDTSQQLLELSKKTDEAIKGIDKSAEAGMKQINKILDEMSKERSKILEKDPINMRTNIPMWIEEMQEMRAQAERIIGANLTIPVTPQISGMGGGSVTDMVETNMGLVSGAFADANFDVKLKFWGEASPKKPLSETIRDLADQFGGFQELISNLEMSIKFGEAEMQIAKLTREMDKYRAIENYWSVTRSNPYFSINMKAGFKEPQIDLLNSLMGGVQQQISLLKANQLLDILNLFAGSFQFGTTYVPKTGLAMVHEGEKIIPRNVSNNSSVVNHFNISGGNAKDIADQVAKVLKYQRSGELRGVLGR